MVSYYSQYSVQILERLNYIRADKWHFMSPTNTSSIYNIASQLKHELCGAIFSHNKDSCYPSENVTLLWNPKIRYVFR